MRTLLTILDSTCRRLVLLASVAFLLAAGGCSMERNEDEGDPGKPLAEYRVSISKSKVALTEQDPTDQVTLRVDCVLLDGSIAFPINNAAWSVDNPLHLLVEAEVVQDNPASSTAKLRIRQSDSALFFGKLFAKGAVLGAQSTALVAFYPKNVPLGFSVTGQRWVIVQFPIPLGPDVRQPTPALKPELSFSPQPLPIPASGTGEITKEVTIAYRGEPTELVAIALSGADAAKFRLLRPILPLATDTLFMVTVPVTFLGLTNANDRNYYNAEITARTRNEATRIVKVSAHQN